MKQQDLLILIERYLDGTATGEEKELLQQYYNSFTPPTRWDETELGNAAETEQQILRRITAAIHQRPATIVSLYRRRWVAVAVSVMLLSLTAWWFLKDERIRPAAASEQGKTATGTAGKNTILLLADGSVIALDSQPDGMLVRTENTLIRKEGRSITVTVPKTHDEPDEAIYHTLKTPKGKQYKAVLEDGSQVWLNTASSIRFPAVFSSDERRVEVTGEAYFEVAKDAARPFRVVALSQQGSSEGATLVEVLGTHFNINAYDDEGLTKTTLLEGSVRVGLAQPGYITPPDAAVLQPGEQAQISVREPVALSPSVSPADVGEVLAWKSNVFQFNNTDLQNIMRQLARWYDVEVVYASKIPARNFSGKISRDAPLSTVLEIFEQSNIHFTVKRNKIIVKS